MGWTRFILLGDLGQQLDLRDQDDRLSELAIRHGRRARAQSARDREQDAALAELEGHVLQLEAGVAGLVNLLRAKRIATDEEIAECFELATREAEKALAAKVDARVQEAAAEAKERAERKLERARRRR